MRRVAAPLLALVALAGAARGAVDFETSVLPVLEEKCFRCHRAAYEDDRGRLRKPKGGLRLDGRAWIEWGVDGEPVVTPGDVEASPLWGLTVLDEDDPDRMPKSGEGLTAREAEVLRRWIDEGASFGAWVGAARDASPPPPPEAEEAGAGAPSPRLAGFLALGEGVPAATSASIEALARLGARVEPVVAGSPLLRVSFPVRDEREWGELGARLRAVARNVAWLDLSRTGVGDDVAERLPELPRLVRLDLRGTTVSDRGAAALARFDRLEDLNLFGTRVTDAGLAKLGRLESLRVVRVGETGCTEEGIRALREAQPGVRVVGDPFETDR
ncbi:MAG: c-type cytochrome domain-containing protein [Planctomycetota bacterium JB042]